MLGVQPRDLEDRAQHHGGQHRVLPNTDHSAVGGGHALRTRVKPHSFFSMKSHAARSASILPRM